MTEPSDSDPNPYAAPELLELPTRKLGLSPLAEPIVTRGVLTLPEVRAAYLMSPPASSTNPWLGAGFVVGSAICMAVLAYFARHRWLWLFALLGILIVLFEAFRQRRRTLAAADHAFAMLQQQVVEMTIDATGITMNVANERISTTWPEVHNYQRDRRLDLLLLAAPQGRFIFVRSHFASEADWKRFQRAIAYYVLNLR